MNQTPITESQLQSWSEHFNGCPQRRLAELALAKAALNDAA